MGLRILDGLDVLGQYSNIRVTILVALALLAGCSGATPVQASNATYRMYIACGQDRIKNPVAKPLVAVRRQ